MDLTKYTKPDGSTAKMRTETREWYTYGAAKLREAEGLFDTFLKELELSGYKVERLRCPTVDLTTQFAHVSVEHPKYSYYWCVGLGVRLDFFVMWGTFNVAPEFYGFSSVGTYEETFKDAQDAMDWVSDYIRSVEEHGKAK
jgi:hypothetical protein